MYSFGETELMDNIELPAMQEFFKQRLGFPIPFIPMGILGLPIPRQQKLTVVVGKPIDVPKIAAPSPAQVDAVHSLYFARLSDMYYRHREAAGFGNMELRFVDQKH